MTHAAAGLTRARAGRVPLAVMAMIGLAWAVVVAAQATGASSLVHHDVLLSDGPPALPAIALFVIGWQVMLTAMMLPSSLPLVGLFATASAKAPRSGAAMAAFLSGYALVWTGFGALAAVLDMALHAGVEASPWLDRHQWLIGGTVLALAGAFQFTKLKDACLDRCRHPAAFIWRHYERGIGGGLRLGARHAAFCVGCCWALMLVMFAVGVTSLLWMAALTALMVHEKTRPSGAAAVPVTGVALLAGASITTLYSAHGAGVI